METDLLTKLHDIHIPPDISIWPLALGWYCVIVMVLAIIFLGCYQWLRIIRKNRLKKIVLKRLDELQNQQEICGNISEELSMLLKRSALATYPRQKVAGLHGDQWLQFLDETSMTTEFSQGPGRLLIVSPYRGQPEHLPESLFHLIKNWVKKNL